MGFKFLEPTVEKKNIRNFTNNMMAAIAIPKPTSPKTTKYKT